MKCVCNKSDFCEYTVEIVSYFREMMHVAAAAATATMMRDEKNPNKWIKHEILGNKLRVDCTEETCVKWNYHDIMKNWIRWEKNAGRVIAAYTHTHTCISSYE